MAAAMTAAAATATVVGIVVVVVVVDSGYLAARNISAFRLRYI